MQKQNPGFPVFCFVIFALWLAYVPEAKAKEEDVAVHPRRRRSADLLPTAGEAQLIVDTHNEFRSIIGDEGEEPIPSNMRHMTWDDGLALTSLTYAKKCVWKHSEYDERKTDQFKDYNGENLWAGDRDHVTNFDPVYGITKWFKEYKDYTFANNSCVPGKKCGHYTQVVWAHSYKIGCAWTVCPKLVSKETTLFEAMYMVCQYAPAGNVLGEKAYLIGPRCSKCNSFDTCPDDALCHNAKRDVSFRFQSNSGATAGILSAIVIILAAAIGTGYYVYTNHKSKALQLMARVRKTRRVSSTAVLTESKTSPPNDEDPPNKGQVDQAETETVDDDAKTRGARLSSIEIDTNNIAP